MPEKKPFLVINTEFKLDAWHDPWGRILQAEVIKDIIYLIESEEIYEYPDEWVDNKIIKAPVYFSDDGDKFYVRYPLDYFGKTQYLPVDIQAFPPFVSYERPNEYKRYVLHGSPAKWDKKYQKFQNLL